jgi:O-methyltransferase involved in polyketide biosynthesis
VAEFDVNVPNTARVSDYWLGGKDNFAADREFGDKLRALYPAATDIVRENKQFMRRTVAWVGKHGVSQFIDLGAGLPTSPSTQEVAQAGHPDARVAYVDNDSVVVVHLRALLAHGAPGVTVVEQDLRDVGAVLAEVSDSMDLRQPVGLLLGSLLHFFPVEDGRKMLDGYLAALAPDSYVVFSLGRAENKQSEEFISAYRQGGGARLYYYSADAIDALFSDLELVPPGITEVRAWGVNPATLPPIAKRVGGDMVGAVARVPVR